MFFNFVVFMGPFPVLGFSSSVLGLSHSKFRASCLQLEGAWKRAMGIKCQATLEYSPVMFLQFMGVC